MNRFAFPRPGVRQTRSTPAAEPAIRFFENLAKAGAALVTVRDQADDTSKIPAPDLQHTPQWKPEDKKAQNYHSRLAESVRFQGSLVSIMFRLDVPSGYDVCECELDLPFSRSPGDPPITAKGLTREMIGDLAQQAAEKARLYQSLAKFGL